MLRSLILLVFIFVNTSMAMAGAECNVAGVSENKTPFKKRLFLKGPGEFSSEIMVFPDGTVSMDPEASQEYIREHRIPGKSYDDSEEGIQNSLNLLHGTYVFSVYSDESGSELVNLSISVLNARTRADEGPILIASTVDQSGSKLSLTAHPKVFRGGSLVKLTFDCAIR